MDHWRDLVPLIQSLLIPAVGYLIATARRILQKLEDIDRRQAQMDTWREQVEDRFDRVQDDVAYLMRIRRVNGGSYEKDQR